MRPARTRLSLTVAAMVAATMSLLPALADAASPSTPDLSGTSQFKGVNWARIGDNFSTGPLVPQGLAVTDDYRTVRTKANAMLAAFQSIGANTVRLPINPATVNTDPAAGPDWWDSYTGAIDAATAKGFKVVLSYWEEGAQGGKIVNLATWNAMWNTVVARYRSNPRVYFDPMNEPHGYSAADWMDIAAQWMSDRPSVPRDRIIVAGPGFDWDVDALCRDSRFDGTYLAYHHYSWDPDVQNVTTYDGWVANFKSHLGNCASRTILEEFGATMDSGLNYDDPTSTDPEVLYLRAYTDTARSLHMGTIYWAGIGGRYMAEDNVGAYETLNVQRLYSGTVNTPLWTPNTTGLDRLRYAWGVGSGSATTTLRSGGDCLDVSAVGQATAAVCRGTDSQQWTRTAARQITVYNGQKCLDVEGVLVDVSSCTGADNQKWTFYTDGTIRDVHSGRCLQVNRATAKVELADCRDGDRQQWRSA